MRIFILVVQGSNYGSAPGGKSVSLDSNHFFPLNFVGYSKKKKKTLIEPNQTTECCLEWILRTVTVRGNLTGILFFVFFFLFFRKRIKMGN